MLNAMVKDWVAMDSSDQFSLTLRQLLDLMSPQANVKACKEYRECALFDNLPKTSDKVSGTTDSRFGVH